MSIFGKLFSHKADVENEIVAQAPTPVASPERDSFYKDLKAQQDAKAETMIFGEDEISDEEKNELVKKIVQVNPMKDCAVVQQGDDDLVDAQDAAPAGQVFGGKDDGRFADIWSTFARINPRILRHFVSRAFIGYPTCTLLGTHEFIHPFLMLPCKDAVAPGYKLNCVSFDHAKDDGHIEKEEDWLQAMSRRAKQMGIHEAMIKLAYYTRLYGIGVAVPRCELIGGHTFEEEYDPSFIKPGSYKGMSIVDPQRFTWDLTEETLYDPLSEYYMHPEFLRLYNKEDTRIHRSWLTVCYYTEVGDDLKGTYMWGGAPLSQFLYERVFCADKLANEIVALAMSKRTVVKDGNMKAMIAEPNKTNHFIERWNGFRNNQAIAFKEPGEQIQQLETSLSDLQPLSAQQYQYAAAIAGVPVTKAMKNVPSGLQATGQYEQDEYEQTLKDIQEEYLDGFLQKHYELDIASSYPDRTDLKVSVIWNPIQLPKASEVQQIASQKVSMVCQLIQTSVITATEARAMLREGESGVFSVISSETPELIKKLEEMKDPEKQQELQMKAQQAQMGGMGGGMPGMPGAPGGAQGQQPNPEFEANKNVFQEVLKEVQGGGGSEGDNENDAEQGQQNEESGGAESPSGEESSAPATEQTEGQQQAEQPPEE